MSSDEEEIVPRRKRNVRVIVDEEEEQSSSSSDNDSEAEGGSGDEDDDDEEGSSEASGSSSEEVDSAAEDEGGAESEWEEIPQELLFEGCQQQKMATGVAVMSTKKAIPATSRKAADAAGEASDSDLSDAQAERCAVCLNRFLGQEVGTPESCDHIFCLDCIQEWAKNMNTCPVDRSVFRLILVRKGDHVVHQISVPAPGEQEEHQEQEDLTYCEVCGRCDREDRLLLCDACDLGYHCECLSPPLDSVPIEEWYCPDCAPDHASLEGEEDEPLPDDMMEEFRNMLASRFRPGQAGGLRRVIARTRASETVRTRIQRRRAAIEGETASSPEPCQQSLSSARRTPAKRSSAPRRRKASSRKTSSRKTTKRKRRSTGHRRKRKTKTKGSSAKRRRTTTGSSRKTYRKGGKRKNSRRTTRRSRLSSRPLACPPSVRQRIADRLGLARPPPGQSLPLMRRVDLGSSSTFATGPQSVGSSYGPSFSLFGDRDELVSLDGSCDEDGGGDIMVARPRLPRHSFTQVKKSISRPPASSSLNRVRAALAKVSPPPACGDLLGSILEMQSVFHSKGGLSGAIVQRDGSLDLRAVPSSARKCPRSPPGSPAESPASPPPSSIGGHSTGSTNQAPSRRVSSGGGYSSSYVGASGDNSTPSRHDDHAQREGCGSYQHIMVPSPPDTYARKNGRDRTKNGPVEEDDDIDIYSDIDDGDDSGGGDGGGDGVNHNGDDTEPSVNGESPTRVSAAVSIGRESVPRRVPAGIMEHDEESSASENELVIDEQENAADVPEEEEVADDHSKPADESEEEGPILETDNVRSPSPENDGGMSQASDEGGLEIVENGNSSDGDQGEDESNGAKEGDDCEEAGDGDGEEGEGEEEEEQEKTEGQPLGEEESSQMNPEEEETGSVPVEDTPASPTEEGTSFVQDAPTSPPAEDCPSSPLEATPSPPTPVDAPASPPEDVVPGASPIESGEDSSAPVSPEAVPADEQMAEPGKEGEDEQENDEKAIAETEDGDEEDTQDNASSPKEIESPEADPEDEEREEQEESSLPADVPGDEIASPAPESKEPDDGGVLLGNLLDTEDISSSEEEGLLEDTSNGMEDISEPGSTDGLVDNLDAVVREQEEPWRQEQRDEEHPPPKERKTKHKKETCHHRKHRRHRRTNSNNEDREEGEIVEERSPSSSSRRRKEAETSADDLAELAPRINISELPRIPKLKRSDKAASHTGDSESSVGGDSTSATVASHTEMKRTSVLGRVDSGSDISWKKLSKHSRERSYRDGKQRDDTVLYKEREIKKREKESRVERSSNLAHKDTDAKASSPSPPPPKKKERRPDRELYVRPDKKRDWSKKDKEKERSSYKDSKTSSSSSHKDDRDKYKERDKHSSSGSSSKERTRHSSKDRRRSSSKERREHRHSSRHHRDHSDERSSEKSSKHKDSRRADDRESRRHDDRDSRDSREKRDSRETRSSRENRDSRDSGSRGRESRDARDSRDSRESRDVRESRESRESRDVARESRESRDSRESKDSRESRESRETRESREVTREPRRTEEKIKVVVEKDYWRDKHERRKERSPSPYLEETEEHTPIESKEVIAKGDSIIINVNFNRSKKETKVAPMQSKDADMHSKSSTRESRSRKREASSPTTPQYGSDSDVESSSKRRRRHHPIGHDGNRDESEASEQDDEQEAMERSPASPAYDFGDQASASSPSVSDGFADNKPSTPPEVHPSPPSPATADKSPTSSQATPQPPEPPSPPLPQPPISSGSAIKLSPRSPPSPPEDNSYDPCEPTKSPSPPPPPMATATTATETDPCPPPEPELPPLPPEPEPPARSVMSTAASMPMTLPVPSVTVAASVSGPPVLPTMTGLQLQPPPPFLPARPLTTVVGNLAGAWAPAAAPVILGLRAPFVPPALGALLPPPMGLLPLRPPPAPIVRLTAPPIVTAPPAAPPTTLSLPPEPAVRVTEQTGVVDMDVSTPPLYSPTDVPISPPEPVTVPPQPAPAAQKGSFDSLLPTDRKSGKSSSKSKRQHSSSSGGASLDAKHVIHFMVDKGKGGSSNTTRSRSESKFSSRSMDESQLQILDELPSSAVEMQVKDKFLKKLNRQERVVEEVKLALKPYYNRREISKEEYKDILRKSVPKICHNKKGEINPMKIKLFVEGYVRKIKHYRKRLSSEQRHKAS